MQTMIFFTLNVSYKFLKKKKSYHGLTHVNANTGDISHFDLNAHVINSLPG